LSRAEDIRSLKKELREIERGLGGLQGERLAAVVALSERMKGLLGEIEEVKEKEKSSWNPAFSTRVKMARKGYRLSKALHNLRAEVASEFEKGDITEDAGKRFISIINLWEDSKKEEAKREFRHFEKLLEMGRRQAETSGRLDAIGKGLRRERAKAEGLLGEISAMKGERIDEGKVSRYKELQGELRKLEGLRKEYISSLASKPVMVSLGELGRLQEHFTDFPPEAERAQLAEFLSRYPGFRDASAERLCEYLSYSDKKLSHVCPETTLFRRLVGGQRRFIEALADAGASTILSVDDEKALDFLAAEAGGDGIVRRIRLLREDEAACKEEFEKAGRVERMRKDLSGHSKSALEAEIAELDRLLKLLEDGPETEETGLLAKISSLFMR
jgi:hypothetical protein